MVVGRLLSFWEDLFSGAFWFDLGRVTLELHRTKNNNKTASFSTRFPSKDFTPGRSCWWKTDEIGLNVPHHCEQNSCWTPIFSCVILRYYVYGPTVRSDMMDLCQKGDDFHDDFPPTGRIWRKKNWVPQACDNYGCPAGVDGCHLSPVPFFKPWHVPKITWISWQVVCFRNGTVTSYQVFCQWYLKRDPCNDFFFSFSEPKVWFLS